LERERDPEAEKPGMWKLLKSERRVAMEAAVIPMPAPVTVQIRVWAKEPWGGGGVEREGTYSRYR
jgi:hypothetical protein